MGSFPVPHKKLSLEIKVFYFLLIHVWLGLCCDFEHDLFASLSSPNLFLLLCDFRVTEAHLGFLI